MIMMTDIVKFHDIAPPAGDATMDGLTELERALRLVVPSLQDHRLVALTIKMQLKRRGVELVRVG